jgi:hypothetical protein
LSNRHPRARSKPPSENASNTPHSNSRYCNVDQTSQARQPLGDSYDSVSRCDNLGCCAGPAICGLVGIGSRDFRRWYTREGLKNRSSLPRGRRHTSWPSLRAASRNVDARNCIKIRSCGSQERQFRPSWLGLGSVCRRCARSW